MKDKEKWAEEHLITIDSITAEVLKMAHKKIGRMLGEGQSAMAAKRKNEAGTDAWPEQYLQTPGPGKGSGRIL